MVAPVTRAGEDQYLGEHQVYTPHRAGLPPLRSYGRELWRRRQFVHELARAELKAQNFGSVFGQLWLVLNPLLNAGVYYVLVGVLNPRHRPPEFLPHLLAGIFAWTFLSGVISQAAGSVVGGGKLILNTAFPRLLLPITQVVVAFFRFLPTLLVLAVAVLWVVPHNLGATTLLFPAVFVIIALTASGLGFISATLQVYFRDFKNLLPYLLRLGLYLTPILFFAEDLKDGSAKELIYKLNPLSRVFQLWSDVIVRGRVPAASIWLEAIAWAAGFFVVGGLLFMSREREFAVRI